MRSWSRYLPASPQTGTGRVIISFVDRARRSAAACPINYAAPSPNLRIGEKTAVGRYCCKSLFASLNTNFPGRTRGDQTLIWGTTLSSDELTGDFGNGLEATSIGDCGLFRPFAKN